VSRLLALAGVALAAAVAASTLLFLFDCGWSGPVADYWFFVHSIDAFEHGAPLWPLLWKPYAGHRLVFPKLFYLADYELFGGRNVALVALDVVLQALTAAGIVGLAWRRGAGLGAGARLSLCVAAAILLLAATHLENLAHAWHLQHFLACGGALVALVAVVEAGSAGERRAAGPAWAWWGAAVGGAVVASFSFGIGMAVWPVLLLISTRARLSGAQRLALVGAAALTALAFLHGYRVGARPEAAMSRDPGSALFFLAACLGAPLSWSLPRAGAAVAAVALAGVAAATLRFVRSRATPDPLEALFLGLALFAAGAALLTALGRAERFPDGWQAHRYQSFVSLFWVGVFGLGFLRGARSRGGVRAALAAAGALWIGAVDLPAHVAEAERMREFAADVRAAHDSILVGVSDRWAQRASLPKVSLRSEHADPFLRAKRFLAERELGMYADGRQRRLGMQVGVDLPAAPEPECRGALVKLSLVAGFLLLEGRAGAGTEILVSGDERRVIGLGRARRPARGFGAGAPRAFTAWAQAPPAGSPIEIWALLDATRVCRVAGPVRIGEWRRSDAGAP
jgi:hypothetical protein